MYHLYSYGTYRDYRPIPRLDVYEGQELDEGDYDAISPGARAAAERELRKRDRQVSTVKNHQPLIECISVPQEALASGRMRPGLLYEESEDEESQPPLARRRRLGERDEGMEFEEVKEVMCLATPT